MKFKPSLALDSHKCVTDRLIYGTYKVGERIAQMVILPYLAVDFIESDTLDDTERGAGGFGSTGTK